MTDHDEHHHVEITDGNRTVAKADVTTLKESDVTARASLHVESGQHPPGTRASLVDAVLDLPEVQDSARVEVTVPLGDAESLHRLQQRCEDVTTRAAGATALVDAEPAPMGGDEQPETSPS